MPLKSNIFVLLLFINTAIYCQITFGTIDPPKPQIKTDTILSKPPPVYDSSNNISIGQQVYFPPSNSSQIFFNKRIKGYLAIGAALKDSYYYQDPHHHNSGNKIRYYDSILTFIYEPYINSSVWTNVGIEANISSNPRKCTDSYYTIINFIDDVDAINIYNSINSWLLYYKMNMDKLSPKRTDIFIDGNHYQCRSSLIVIKNEKTGDTLYTPSDNNFIIVPFFVKQKKVYENKELYSNDGMQWHCTDVSLFRKDMVSQNTKDSNFAIFYVLINDQGKKLIIDEGEIEDYYFKTEYENRQEQMKQLEEQNKLKQEEILRIEEQNRKDSIAKIEKARQELEDYKNNLISKYGEYRGELIFKGDVDIGMTEEMCKIAWGIPWDIEKTTTAGGTKEHWFYSWKYNLYFENGSLVRIEH